MPISILHMSEKSIPSLSHTNSSKQKWNLTCKIGFLFQLLLWPFSSYIININWNIFYVLFPIDNFFRPFQFSSITSKKQKVNYISIGNTILCFHTLEMKEKSQHIILSFCESKKVKKKVEKIAESLKEAQENWI